MISLIGIVLFLGPIVIKLPFLVSNNLGFLYIWNNYVLWLKVNEKG